LTHHPPLATLAGSLVLVFNHYGGIHHSFQVRIVHSYKVGLELLMQSIKEPLSFLLIGVNVIGCIPSLGGKLVKVLGNAHSSLFQIEELVPHDLDESKRIVGLAKLGLEGFPSHHMAFGLHGADILPPCSSCSS
jgi:hypothetical protein